MSAYVLPDASITRAVFLAVSEGMVDGIISVEAVIDRVWEILVAETGDPAGFPDNRTIGRTTLVLIALTDSGLLECGDNGEDYWFAEQIPTLRLPTGPPTRPDTDTYYLGIAEAVSRRGECSRRQVGAVLVKDHTIIATGYNGAPAGEPSCLDGACPRATSDALPGSGYAESGCSAIHAEVNLLIRASRERSQGATLYVTEEPCVLCSPLIRAAGVARVVTPHAVAPIPTVL